MIDVPVSLIGTFAVMAAMGFTLNNLTLFGLVLAIGIVVDDAIVVLENIERLIATGPLAVVEDEVMTTQKTYDTRIRVALEVGTGPDRPLVGHVTAFGGFLHKCFVFDFSTQVDRASDEAVLSSRLAFARTRILAGLELDPFADPPPGRATAADVSGAPR